MSDRGRFVVTPRRALAAIAIVLVFTFVVSWTSLSARAGAVTETRSAAAPQALHTFAVRTAIVDPMKLPPADAVAARHFLPPRHANQAAYLQRKAAASESALPEIPSLAPLPLAAMATLSTNF